MGTPQNNFCYPFVLKHLRYTCCMATNVIKSDKFVLEVALEGRLSGGRRAREATISRGNTAVGSHTHLIKTGRTAKPFLLPVCTGLSALNVFYGSKCDLWNDGFCTRGPIERWTESTRSCDIQRKHCRNSEETQWQAATPT